MSGDELRAAVLAERRAAAEVHAAEYDRRGSRAFTERVERVAALGVAGAVALDQACTVSDRIVELEARVVADGLVVEGSVKQLRLHPALVELRAARAELRGLLDALRPARNR